MFPELSVLPEWLVVGLLLGGGGSIGVATLFVLAKRRYPAPADAPDAGVDGDERRREEIRAYLHAIGESFAEDQPVADQSVAFYLSERDVAITFDARAYYRLERTPTDAVLVEHELPAIALGARLPFDVPDVDFGEAAASRDLEPAVDAFRELGLSPPATVSEVKSAYRERVKDVHPDLGGDEESFKRVRDAYTTAKAYTVDEGPSDTHANTGEAPHTPGDTPASENARAGRNTRATKRHHPKTRRQTRGT